MRRRAVCGQSQGRGAGFLRGDLQPFVLLNGAGKSSGNIQTVPVVFKKKIVKVNVDFPPRNRIDFRRKDDFRRRLRRFFPRSGFFEPSFQRFHFRVKLPKFPRDPFKTRGSARKGSGICTQFLKNAILQRTDPADIRFPRRNRPLMPEIEARAESPELNQHKLSGGNVKRIPQPDHRNFFLTLPMKPSGGRGRRQL